MPRAAPFAGAPCAPPLCDENRILATRRITDLIVIYELPMAKPLAEVVRRPGI
jgi:hypothetical protein